MTTIKEMQQDINDLRSHGNHETLAYSILALAGEVGELANYLKKELRAHGSVDNQEAIEKEVPDILFYLLQFCADRGIDVEKVWDQKMIFNSCKYGHKLSRFA